MYYNDLERNLRCIKRDGSWAASVSSKNQHPVCRQAADALATTRAELAAKDAEIARLREVLDADLRAFADKAATIHQLGENAAKAAGEYAEEVAAKDAALANAMQVASEAANEAARLGAFVEDLAKQWLPGEPEPFDDFDPSFEDAYAIIVNAARAALTEPSDG